MLTNSQMKPERFWNWSRYRKLVSRIKAHLEKDGTVYSPSHTRVTKLTAKHADMIKATRSGIYIQHGKQWLCYNFNRFIFQ